jgi:hypothetical protein
VIRAVVADDTTIVTISRHTITAAIIQTATMLCFMVSALCFTHG